MNTYQPARHLEQVLLSHQRLQLRRRRRARLPMPAAYDLRYTLEAPIARQALTLAQLQCIRSHPGMTTLEAPLRWQALTLVKLQPVRAHGS